MIAATNDGMKSKFTGVTDARNKVTMIASRAPEIPMRSPRSKSTPRSALLYQVEIIVNKRVAGLQLRSELST